MTTTHEDSLARRIGERLRTLRKDRGLTLAALAEQAGMSVSYLSAVENGVNLPSLQLLARLTDALGVSIPAVLAAEGSPQVRVGAIPAADGVVAASHPGLQLETVIVRSDGGRGGAAPVGLEGRDLFVYLVSGDLAVDIDGTAYALRGGDALDAAAPGAVSWSSSGSIAVWASCPTSTST
ncbi:MAG: helix-turn-helix domain-containing protein [Frankiaceae bacterium]